MADSLIPEWLENFAVEQEKQVEGLVEQVDAQEMAEEPVAPKGPALPGAITPQDAQTLGVAPQQNAPMLPGAITAQDAQTLNMAAPPQLPGAIPPPQPVAQPINPDTGLTPEEQAELEMLMQLESQTPSNPVPAPVPSQAELEQAAQGGNEVVVPENQTMGGN